VVECTKQQFRFLPASADRTTHRYHPVTRVSSPLLLQHVLLTGGYRCTPSSSVSVASLRVFALAQCQCTYSAKFKTNSSGWLQGHRLSFCASCVPPYFCSLQCRTTSEVCSRRRRKGFGRDSLSLFFCGPGKAGELSPPSPHITAQRVVFSMWLSVHLCLQQVLVAHYDRNDPSPS